MDHKDNHTDQMDNDMDCTPQASPSSACPMSSQSTSSSSAGASPEEPPRHINERNISNVQDDTHYRPCNIQTGSHYAYNRQCPNSNPNVPPAHNQYRPYYPPYQPGHHVNPPGTGGYPPGHPSHYGPRASPHSPVIRHMPPAYGTETSSHPHIGMGGMHGPPRLPGYSGNGPYIPQNVTPQKTLQPPKLTAVQKVQQWNQHGSQFDSGVQSMSHSSATSVMSSIHAASQISGVSSLPDDYNAGPELSEQQMARFQNIPATFHPADRDNVRRALPELIPLLRDTEEEVVCKALGIVQKIAKFDADNLYSPEPVIRERQVIDGLLHALKMHRNNKKISRLALSTLFNISSNRRHGLDLIVQTIEEKTPNCLDDLLHCISVHEYSCFKYSFLILHNLMTEPKISKQVIAHVRELRTLTQIVGWLGEKNEKLMAIIVDIIQHLVDKCSEQKTFFLSLNGPSRLIKILQSAQYENLLSRATKLLKYITNCDPKKVVDAGALEVLHIHLNHMSQRLVRDLLTCIRDLSDVPSQDRDTTPLLEKLLQLLGTNDLHVKQLCTQILFNLSANNRINKEFLVSRSVINAIFHVLFETESMLNALRSGQAQNLNGQLLEDIQDYSLGILRSVCSGHSLAMHAQCDVMLKRPGDVLLQKLIQKRIVLLRKTLRILSLTATNDANLCRFREIVKTHSKDTYGIFPYIHEIVQTFNIAASQFPMAPVVENVSMAELMQHCMSILASLCRDDFLLHRIFDSLKEFPTELQNGVKILLPQLALREEELVQRATVLIAELCRLPEATLVFSCDLVSMDILRSLARSNAPFGEKAALALGRIDTGGDLRPQMSMGGAFPHVESMPSSSMFSPSGQQILSPDSCPAYNPHSQTNYHDGQLGNPTDRRNMRPGESLAPLALHPLNYDLGHNATIRKEDVGLYPDQPYYPDKNGHSSQYQSHPQQYYHNPHDGPIKRGQCTPAEMTPISVNTDLAPQSQGDIGHYSLALPNSSGSQMGEMDLSEYGHFGETEAMADFEDYSFANVFCPPDLMEPSEASSNN
ncbi:beta-catenin/armadillo-related protein 1 [Ditylenchus destructor]|uniref:Beta-catenin/armadillo-related protein 1 n=1 Tax=Ditylenchus destructor TaxID=166010 RepID=A0AAD4N783_9BILA|nr:beta-catenin/armadillo-related protein 1 [Ditylenchus destructor]